MRANSLMLPGCVRNGPSDHSDGLSFGGHDAHTRMMVEPMLYPRHYPLHFNPMTRIVYPSAVLDDIVGPVSVWAIIKWVAAFLVAWWVHDVPAALKTLLLFQGVDYATGIAAAIVNKQLSSREAMTGFIRKGLIIVLVMMSHAIEMLASQMIGQHIELNLESWGAYGFAITDAISIVENMARARVGVPEKLVQFLMMAKKIAPRMATEEQLQQLDDLNQHFDAKKADIFDPPGDCPLK